MVVPRSAYGQLVALANIAFVPVFEINARKCEEQVLPPTGHVWEEPLF